jgi:glycosyltransferase involved in cell wall biosynthesis
MSGDLLTLLFGKRYTIFKIEMPDDINTNSHKLVSIIIATRNEEKSIKKCLDSVLAQNFPRDSLEVLVVDGMSNDRTPEIVSEYAAKYSFVKLIDNPLKITPSAFNTGIKAAKGEIILIMGAHSIYQNDYISQCVSHLIESGADNVGGVCIALPGGNTLIAESIAYALSSPFGMGNSYFRIGSKTSRYVDTVFGGCYKKDIFEKIGLFDTDLIRGQDTEFNARLRKAGGKILLVPDIISYYTTRETYLKLWKMQWQYGKLKPLVIKKVGKLFTMRQIVAPVFVSLAAILPALSIFSNVFFIAFLGIIGIYTVLNLLFSIQIAIAKNPKCVLLIPPAFAVIHFAWGIGFIKGVFDYILFQKNNKKSQCDMPLTR